MARNASRGSQNQYGSSPRMNVGRSQFDLSHGHKTTLDAGYLVPIYTEEVYPGDTFNVRANLFGRLATPIKPIMSNIYMETFFFFVRTRLVWDNFEEFMGEQDDPELPPVERLVPTSNTVGGHTAGALDDYFGIPGVPDLNFNALPHRCYQLIWADWFRDQNLERKPIMPRDDGGGTGNKILRRRGKRHDYFTSCLPWPVKPTAQSNIPVTGLAPVQGIGIGPTLPKFTNSVSVLEATSDDTSDQRQYANFTSPQDAAAGTATPFEVDAAGIPQIFANMQGADGVFVNDLRMAFQVQRLLERDARSGTRLPEIVFSHFGVLSEDARHQRPEFLGGGRSMVNVNQVAQTSATAELGNETPQGNLSAVGTVMGNKHGFVKTFTEHGYIIGLVSFRADLEYQQGLHRMWSRSTKYDFYWPALARLGEQAVLNKEIEATGGGDIGVPGWDEQVFGYQERYGELRTRVSYITGEFKSRFETAGPDLDYWHLGQDFGLTSSLPAEDRVALNADFIQENPPIDRVIAVPTEPHFLLDCWFNIKAARPMPAFGIPGMVDHF